MLAFIDFEASSLGRHSYPIEVAWVFEDGGSATHLIRPAPGWDDWDVRSEAIHKIPRDQLLLQGTPHEAVAHAMVEALAGHDPVASAPSWDGKWLSTLLRAAGLPRHTLRLRHTVEAQRETARDTLRDHVPPADMDRLIDGALAEARGQRPPVPAHRALADALAERDMWLGVRAAARHFRTSRGAGDARSDQLGRK